MQLIILNSNSAGNCYLLEASNGETLIIELGVRFDKIKRALGYDLKKVAGAIVTHDHLDHSKAIDDALKAGISVYTSEGTHEAMNILYHHRAHVIEGQKMIGMFKVKPFDVKHDAREPLGFLIHHPECGNVLFLTDSYYCEYTFRDLNNIIIEANYSQEILDRRLEEGVNPKFLRDRVITSHMSLATCKQTLQANDLSKVNNIMLIHLSDRNSNATQFQREVQEATGKTVHIADAGVIIPFNKTPF